MHKVETSHKKNLLVIHLNGFKGSKREVFVSEIEQASTNLALGFSCIIILSKYTVISDKELRDLENLLYAYGLKTMVYVGQRHCSTISKSTEASLDPAYIGIHRTNSIEEAEQVLSTLQ